MPYDSYQGSGWRRFSVFSPFCICPDRIPWAIRGLGNSSEVDALNVLSGRVGTPPPTFRFNFEATYLNTLCTASLTFSYKSPDRRNPLQYWSPILCGISTIQGTSIVEASNKSLSVLRDRVSVRVRASRSFREKFRIPYSLYEGHPVNHLRPCGAFH